MYYAKLVLMQNVTFSKIFCEVQCEFLCKVERNTPKTNRKNYVFKIPFYVGQKGHSKANQDPALVDELELVNEL